MSTSYHYLNDDFTNVARAAVCSHPSFFLIDEVPDLISQIFESGTASTLPVFDAYRNIPSWMLFANNIQFCATASINNTFGCLMSASESDILAAMNASLAIEPFPFYPVLDGPGGILSDYPAMRLSRGAGGDVPLMAGTNLDEGWFLPRCGWARCSCQHRDDIYSTGFSD